MAFNPEGWFLAPLRLGYREGKIRCLKGYNIKRPGFTLVEVIVLLVILAILAAILVPTLLGWVDSSRGKAAVAEGRMILSVAQGAVDQAYAVGNSNKDKKGDVSLVMKPSDPKKYPNAATFLALLSGDISSRQLATVSSNNKLYTSAAGKNGIWAQNCVIQPFIFQASNGYRVVYDGELSASEDKPAIPSKLK